MKKITLFILCTFSCLSLWSQQSKRVYFIGNSYTSSQNIPQIVANIAQTSNDVLTFQQTTPGGSTLFQHSNNAVVQNNIDTGNWDYVVLQEQSQIPSFSVEQVRFQMFPPAENLANRIRAQNPCATPIFYMTWGRKNGDNQNCPYLPYVCTYTGMDDAIRLRYEEIAASTNSVVSPVGAVWRYLRTNHPEIELYTGDGSHQSVFGAIASAYTFYTVIFKKDPNAANYNHNQDAAKVALIKNAVKEVVYNHQAQWHIGVNDNPSRFNYQNTNGNTYQFTTQTGNATTFTWSFGDGNTSIERNPQHTYTQTGTFTVSLTSNACNQTTVFTKTITITQLSASEFNLDDVKIYPNPAKNKINLSGLNVSENSQIALYNSLGQHILERNSEGNSEIQLQLDELPSGLYFIKLKSESAQKTFTIIKE